MHPNPSQARKSLHRRLHYLRIAGSSLGCFAAIAIIGYLSGITHSISLLPSFGASCVIGLLTPNSTFAQPRNVIGGHLASGCLAVLCFLTLGHSIYAIGLAVALSAAAMQLTRTVHPPAAADPIFFLMQSTLSWQGLLAVLLSGTALLVAFFFLFHRFVSRRPYPAYWL